MTVLTDLPQADASAPFGYMRDPVTGQVRAKKRPGRKRKDPVPAAPAFEVPEHEGSQDPGPGWGDGAAKPGKTRVKFADVPKQVKDDVAGLAGLVATPLLAILQQADPYCGTVLAQNFEPILDATLPLICRSEKVVRYFTGDKSDWMIWGKLAMALAPVAKAIADHHVFRTVEVRKNQETGEIQVLRRQPSEGHGSHLQPPAQEEYSYTA